MRRLTRASLGRCYASRGWKTVVLGGVSLTALHVGTGVALAQEAGELTTIEAAESAAGVPQVPVTGEPAGEENQILVTGSRVRQSGMDSPNPVVALGGEQLDQMAPGNIIDSLSQLPQFYNNETSETTLGATTNPGASVVNLRGLGANRTLTLLNGRRVVPFNRAGSVNLNLLPQALIERVEIVTGGASAAYGSDAVAGVANFVLDTDFAGVEIDVQAGSTTRWDAENFEASVSAGTAIGERAHLIVSFNGYKQSEVPDYRGRDWYQGYAPVTNPIWLATRSGPKEIIAPNVVATNFTCNGLILAPGTSIDRLAFSDDGSYAPFVRSELSAIGGNNTQSIAPQYGGGSGCNPSGEPGYTGLGGSQIASGIERFGGFAYLDYDVTDDVTAFLQAFATQDIVSSRANTAPMHSLWGATIFRENAFLPDGIRQAMADEGISSFRFARYNGDISRGRSEARNRTYSVTAGFNANLHTGSFFDDWSLDGYYQWGKNNHRLPILGYTRPETLFVALDAIRHPDTGEIICRASLFDDRWAGCVPLNLFGKQASEAAIDYATMPTSIDDTVVLYVNTEQQDAELVASGDIWEGWGAGSIAGAFGANYRIVKLDQSQGPPHLVALNTPTNRDPGVRGLPPGIAGDPDIHQFASITDLKGKYDVLEGFAEVVVPILADAPVAESLELNAAARYARYSGSGGIWAYKVGLDWQVISDLRLRGTYSRDVRAANMSERFDTTRAGTRIEDPVTGRTYQISLTTGGNPDVAPEKADTYTVGAVYRPAWLSGLSLSVDYYNLDIAGAIGQLGSQRIVDDCSNGAQSLCALITRDPQTDLITDVADVFININQEVASGVDFEALYTTPVSWLSDGSEDLMLRGFVTYLAERATVLSGAEKDDQADDMLAGLPRWQGTGMISYTNGPFTFFVQERYIGGGKRDTNEVEGVDIDENDVESVWYTNLNASYEFGAGGATWEVFGHIANLFDADPPIVPEWSSFTGASQTVRSLYDLKGRRFVVGANIQF